MEVNVNFMEQPEFMSRFKELFKGRTDVVAQHSQKATVF